MKSLSKNPHNMPIFFVLFVSLALDLIIVDVHHIHRIHNYTLPEIPLDTRSLRNTGDLEKISQRGKIDFIKNKHRRHREMWDMAVRDFTASSWRTSIAGG